MKSALLYQDKPNQWSSHTLIAKRLNKLPSQSKVLDVGAASGMLARICENKSLLFFGVEQNEQWAQVAFPFYKKIWIQSIETISEDHIKGYQVVVLGDILEHLPNPENILQKLVDIQSSNSIFIISVPNVANLWIRLNLLFGFFDYTDRGILDRTHLRFFTRKTLTTMIKNAKLEIASLEVTPIPLEMVSPFFTTSLGKIFYSLLAWLTFLLPTLLGYQFIVEAKKHEYNQ